MKEVSWISNAVAEALEGALDGWTLMRGPDGSIVMDKPGCFTGANVRIYLESDNHSQAITIGISGGSLSDSAMEIIEL